MPQPSPLLICFDQLPAWRLGCYGQFHESTPTFDDLAAQSTVFDRYFVSPMEPSLLDQLANRCPDLAVLRIGDHDADVAPADLLNDPPAKHVASFLGEPSPLRVLLIKGLPVLPWNEDDGDVPSVSIEDVILRQLLEILLPILDDDQMVIVTALRGDVTTDPTANPDWLKSVGEAAVHVPLIIHAETTSSADRESRMLTPADLIDFLVPADKTSSPSLAEWRDGIPDQSLSYSSLHAKAIRTEHWTLVERTSGDNDELSDLEEPDVRLFHYPEDPWLVRDVVGEYFELVESYRQTGRIEPIQSESGSN
ncbi:MAG: hypothetical protein KDA80_06585 [Planctomycetaceae bacterium]|nr:hypothetical protein [Planctomycetaceae bacterium]